MTFVVPFWPFALRVGGTRKLRYYFEFWGMERSRNWREMKQELRLEEKLERLRARIRMREILQYYSAGGLKLTKGNWWVNSDGANLPGCDFTRVIVKPGVNKRYPKGAMGLYVDGNFWSVAVLPPEFISVPVSELVAFIWGDEIMNPTFETDYYETETP